MAATEDFGGNSGSEKKTTEECSAAAAPTNPASTGTEDKIDHIGGGLSSVGETDISAEIVSKLLEEAAAERERKRYPQNSQNFKFFNLRDRKLF